MVALVMIIVGIYHIFLATYNYTADAYGEYSSSAIAGQSLLRNGFAAAFPLFSTQMFTNMGYQWGTSRFRTSLSLSSQKLISSLDAIAAGLLLACITLLIAPLPYVLFKYGGEIARLLILTARSRNVLGFPCNSTDPRRIALRADRSRDDCIISRSRDSD